MSSVGELSYPRHIAFGASLIFVSQHILFLSWKFHKNVSKERRWVTTRQSFEQIPLITGYLSTGQSFLRVLLNNPAKLRFSSSAAPALTEKLDIQPASRHINPLEHPDYFNVANLFTVRDLFEARVHFGHKEGSLDDRMKSYLYGSRLGHTIFDLDQTAEHLRRALNVTAHIAFQGGIIVFFCRNALNAHNVEKAAMECGEFSHTRYWRGGVFTNANIQFKAVTSKYYMSQKNLFSIFV